jgi:hypothetical protein
MLCSFPSDGTPAPGRTLCQPTRRKCVGLDPRRLGSGAEAPATGIPAAAGPENVAPDNGAVEGRDLATGGPADTAKGVAHRCCGHGGGAPGTGIPAPAGLDKSAPGKGAFEGRGLCFLRLRSSRHDEHLKGLTFGLRKRSGSRRRRRSRHAFSAAAGRPARELSCTATGISATADPEHSAPGKGAFAGKASVVYDSGEAAAGVSSLRGRSHGEQC